MIAEGRRQAAEAVDAASERLNRGCFCRTLDRDALCRAFVEKTGDPTFCTELINTRPHLFSNVAVFVPAEAVAKMEAAVGAIEAMARRPAYRDAVLSWAPDIARFDPGPIGAFMGYDFHVDGAGPQLIEINTNAGGAFLNAPLARAQGLCCQDRTQIVRSIGANRFEAAVFDMFKAEWRRQKGTGLPKRVAIVDDDPAGQYLYPEFVLAQRFFRRRGIDAVIADGSRLVYEGGVLALDGQAIDLVYNRLTDFALDREEHAAVRSAYRDAAVVVTPNPRAHGLFADKRNLVILSDPERLQRLGAREPEITALAEVILQTRLVTPDNAQHLWDERKRLFFKPAGGHGGKAAYRGDKLTRSVWASIIRGGYVAQRFAPPGERAVRVDAGPGFLKVDVRLYTYAGDILLGAARLYQGQTTNFRTPGGGFAPVFQVCGVGERRRYDEAAQ